LFVALNNTVSVDWTFLAIFSVTEVRSTVEGGAEIALFFRRLNYSVIAFAAAAVVTVVDLRGWWVGSGGMAAVLVGGRWRRGGGVVIVWRSGRSGERSGGWWIGRAVVRMREG